MRNFKPYRKMFPEKPRYPKWSKNLNAYWFFSGVLVGFSLAFILALIFQVILGI